jgi:DNA (cytosine-5)-methyltransferase 1
MFPEAVRAVRECRPKAFLFENVKGLLRQSFKNYFEYVRLQLSNPEIERRSHEDWFSHLSRLEKHHTGGKIHGLKYRVVCELLNAADYGVPQRRERVFLVGIRNDLGLEWSFPEATHSEAALVISKWKTGEYWEKHRVAKKERGPMPESARLAFAKPLASSKKPWLTVRDAIGDLPEPNGSGRGKHLNHIYQPGARTYPGHTGSPLDEPAKTLKAGDHGVPGGENMMVLGDGSVRYFTIRESSRLQTFPDDYAFRVSWTEAMRQIGNAVPVTLAHAVAKHLYAPLSNVSRA